MQKSMPVGAGARESNVVHPPVLGKPRRRPVTAPSPRRSPPARTIAANQRGRAARKAAPGQEAVMGQAIPTQHPAVVLRSHYNHLRTLLAVAMIAIAGLTAAVVIVATNDETDTGVSSQSALTQQEKRWSASDEESAPSRPNSWPPPSAPSASPPAPVTTAALRKAAPTSPRPRHARPRSRRSRTGAPGRRLATRRAPLQRRPRGRHPRPDALQRPSPVTATTHIPAARGPSPAGGPSLRGPHNLDSTQNEEHKRDLRRRHRRMDGLPPWRSSCLRLGTRGLATDTYVLVRQVGLP